MELNKYIDHTMLKANANKEDIIKLCFEAKKYSFASVCVNPTWVSLAKNELIGTDVKVCTVVGFPLGATFTEVKVFETEIAIEKGAEEIDMVINIGNAKEENFTAVYDDIKAVVNSAKGKVVKVIIETCLLTKEEIVEISKLCVKAGADFIKTSTGFSTGGATVEDVKIIKDTIGDSARIKASGGIKTYEDLKNMINTGADRIGTSSGVALINGKSGINTY